jgi:hypothetical protein
MENRLIFPPKDGDAVLVRLIAQRTTRLDFLYRTEVPKLVDI